MRNKTSKIFAGALVTAMLGSALCLGAYAIGKTDNNSGFKGAYNLSALAENNATASTVTVKNKTIDTTSTLALTSINNDYTLLITVVDTDDMSDLADIKVGYTIGENVYNGQASGLSNVIYSSLTVKTGDEEAPTATVSAAELGAFNSAITTAKLVIAEVEGSISQTPALTIDALRSYTKDFSDGTITSACFDIGGSTDVCGLTYCDVTYTKAMKTTSNFYLCFNLTQSGTLTMLVASKAEKVPSIAVDDITYVRPDENTETFYLISVELAAGEHTISNGKEEAWLCFVNVVTEGEVSRTAL